MCPKIEKSCPLSEVKWPDDLSRLLNEPENECLLYLLNVCSSLVNPCPFILDNCRVLVFAQITS